MVHFAKAIGFTISFLPIELLENQDDGVRNWEARFIRYRPELGLHSSDSADSVRRRVDEAYNSILKMKKEGWPILNSTPYLRASHEYLKTGLFPSKGCDAGRLYFSVAPNGQFTICHRTQHKHIHFLDEGFEKYFHSEHYRRKQLLEAASCEGCMRACWIDTSSMFRSVEGFFETAMLTFKRPTAHPISYEQAQKWARRDDSPIIPISAK